MVNINEYNKYPDNMQEINPYDIRMLDDFFTYCLDKTESRQAYKGSLNGPHETLKIAWVDKDNNLGYAIGRNFDNKIHYYRIGSDDDWRKRSNAFCAMFAGDNS